MSRVIDVCKLYNWPAEIILNADDWATVMDLMSPSCRSFDEHGPFAWIRNTKMRPPKASKAIVDLSTHPSIFEKNGHATD